jgi:hypothetical protein
MLSPSMTAAKTRNTVVDFTGMMSLELVGCDIWLRLGVRPFQPDNDFDGRGRTFAQYFFEEVAALETEDYFIPVGAAGRAAGTAAGADIVAAGRLPNIGPEWSAWTDP